MSYDFKGIIKAKREIYYNSEKNWGVYQCQIILVKDISENIPKDIETFVVKGNTASLRINDKYHLTAKYVTDKKHGNQLEIVCIANAIDQYPKDSYTKRKVLNELFTAKQVDAMYQTYEEPYDVFMGGDMAALTRIKGCGIKNAALWMEKFNNFIPLNKIYLELEHYELTNNMIQRLLGQYKSADLVIEKVKNNPYCLCEISGIGWKTADQIAQRGGVKEFSIERISSFVVSYLTQQGNCGYSYVEPSELMSAIIENIGDAVPDFVVTEAIHSLDKKLFWNEDKTLIGLRKFWNLENKIADEVIRLLNAPSSFVKKDYSDLIKLKEKEQGWEYTPEQLAGVELALNKNLVIITGGAGTGKSSLVGLVLSILGASCRYAQTALSGRAAARLAEVTHQEGHTIHRLLGFPLGPKEKGGFLYNDENQLNYDVIIIDEAPMIGGELFYSLLRAIKTGSKVIMLGDTGQLEAIGECNVAYDLLASPHIPKQLLTQCHRQALKSAIITESIKIRNGQQIINKGWAGTTTLGELQDLTLDCYSDAGHTYQKVIHHFNQYLKREKDIMKIQVLSPVKIRGDACIYQLNLALQAIYNPTKKEEIVIRNTEGMIYGIKEGDKVINTKNCYGVSIAYTDEETTNAYNGNIGIVLKVNKKGNSVIIDFQDVSVVEMQGKQLDNIELAYVTSVHKYQGSECECVIVALDFSAYTLLSRELVYTALTRAKKHCTLIAQNKSLSYATERTVTQHKRTYLTDILHTKLLPTNKFEF